MKFKIRYSDQIVGFFSLLAMALLVLFVFFLGAKQSWFVKKNIYYTYFNSGSGLVAGMDVTYKGFSLGKIKDVRLDGTNVVVEFFILREYAEYVKENSLVELITSPIGLGASFVLYPGKGPELLPSGSEIYRIDSFAAREIIESKRIRLEKQDDSIGALMKKVSSVLDNVNLLLSSVNGAVTGRGQTPLAGIVENVEEITGNVAVLSKYLSSGEGAVPKILGPDLTDSLDELMRNISLISQELTRIVGSADSLMANIAPELDALLVQLNSALLEAQDVLIGVKNNPLIRGGVPDRKSGKASTSQLRSGDF